MFQSHLASFAYCDVADLLVRPAANLLPILLGAQIVWFLGHEDNPLWMSKEVIGASAAVTAAVPFAAILYPAAADWNVIVVGSIPSRRLWTLRYCLWMAFVSLAAYYLLTIVGIHRWGWHQPDAIFWRRIKADE